MWAQPEAGAEVLLAQRPARLPRASRAPQIWLPGFGCLAPASWSPGPRGDTWPPETELLTLEKRTFVARPSPAAGALRPGEKSSHDLSSERKRGASAQWRAPGWQPADPEAESPRGGWELDAVGARTARARLHPLFRRAGSRARGLGAGRGRQSAPPGAGSAAGARRGLWGRRVPGPACPCPPPAMPGFDYKFLEKPKRRLLCPLCGKPMREPVQVSTCGHRFCDTCLQEFLRCGPGGEGNGRGRGDGGRRVERGPGRRRARPLSAPWLGDLRGAHRDVTGRR